jgi:hypothetical protein
MSTVRPEEVERFNRLAATSRLHAAFGSLQIDYRVGEPQAALHDG